MLSYGEDPDSLSHLALNPYRVMTDRQTDRRTNKIPIASMRSQQYLPVQLWSVKTQQMRVCSAYLHVRNGVDFCLTL